MKDIIAGLILIVVGFIGLLVVSSILNGFVLVKLWEWFLVTPFGFPKLSVPVAIGISIIAKYLTIQQIPKTDNKSTDTYCFAIVYPLLTLCIGWVVHLFV